MLPDYTFLDLNMPRMDGKPCLEEFKKDAKLKEISIIILYDFLTSKEKRGNT